MAAIYRAVARTSPQLDLRILGRVLLHAAAVGAAAGLVGVFFVATLDLAEVLLVRATGFAPLCAAGEHCPDLPTSGVIRPWLFVVIPALGALAGGYVARWAPEVAGGGADTIIDAFHEGDGLARKRSIPAKFVASALTLGSGGAGGREGPTMQIGGAIGSVVGQLLRVTPRERRILLVSGVAAGISAVFRTPLGAALLAIEVLHRDDFESDALIPAVLASVVSYSVCVSLLGEGRLFAHAPAYPFEPSHLPLYALLGVFVCAASIVFVRALGRTRRLFARLSGPAWLRPGLGGLTLGVLAWPALWLLGRWTGFDGQRFGLFGGGYGAGQVAITGAEWLPPALEGAGFLLVLAILKLVSTCLTVGSGGSAGDFGPSLAMGALFGGAFGHAARLVDPSIDPGAFALVGMSTFYGGIAHVPLAAIVLVCELAGSYDLLLPLMLAAGIAFVANRRSSLYPSQPRTRRDSPAHKSDLTVDVLRTVRVGDVVTRGRPFETLTPGAPATAIERAMVENEDQDVFPVVDEQGRLLGIVTSDVLRTLASSPDVGALVVAEDVMRPPVRIELGADLHTALEIMLEHGLREIVVVDSLGALVGLLDEAEVGAAYHSATADLPPRSTMSG
jgi:CIC family chloride channel protein